jgi:DNA invertase Pin-like site-specific DNA recombinase
MGGDKMQLKSALLSPYELAAQGLLPNVEVKDRIRRVFHQRILPFTSRLPLSLNHYLPTAVVFAGSGKGLIATSGGTLWDYTDESPPREEKYEDDEDAPERKSDTSQKQNPSGDGHSSSEKCVLMYLRVSTNEQKEDGRSLESQEDELTSIIEANPNIRSFTEDPITDEGETGTDFDREGIRRVGELAQEDEVTHLFVDTIDRIGRSIAETMMFIQTLRTKYGVRVKTRNREFDVRKPTDKMQVTMLAAMADFGTMNRARSALRSSADNFIKDNQWKSWFPECPIGYKEDDDWIQPIDGLKPMIRDIYHEFIKTQNYSQVARAINSKYDEEIDLMEREHTDRLSSQQIKAILSRPVYKGEPTIPVTTLEHYDPNPCVKDPKLQIVSDDTFEKAEIIVEETSEKYSSESDLNHLPTDFAEEFDPFTVETVSPIVQLKCPKCMGVLSANGQYEIDGEYASRMYKCPNSECDYGRRWPHESEREMMRMLTELDKIHSIL